MGADYSNAGGRRFYCRLNGKNFYMACHRYYSNDKFNSVSTILIFHSNPKFHGENFTFETFNSNEQCIYYKDDADRMRNWILYVDKQKDIDYFTPVFHKTKCSKFTLERIDNDFFFI